jgi:hypothetical protein
MRVGCERAPWRRIGQRVLRRTRSGSPLGCALLRMLLAPPCAAPTHPAARPPPRPDPPRPDPTRPAPTRRRRYIVSMFLSQELGVHGIAFVLQVRGRARRPPPAATILLRLEWGQAAAAKPLLARRRLHWPEGPASPLRPHARLHAGAPARPLNAPRVPPTPRGARQSDKHSAAHLARRVEAFVEQLLTRLEAIPEVGWPAAA